MHLQTLNLLPLKLLYLKAQRDTYLKQMYMILFLSVDAMLSDIELSRYK